MASDRKDRVGATVDVLDQQGNKVGQRDLDPAVFDAQVNVPTLHQVVVAGAAAQRAGTHSTKTRSEVSGGGVKPWRQKGTGRARAGSSRSPIWVGGGIAHGPKPREHDLRVPKKMKRLALRSALSDKAREGRVKVVESLSFDGPSTKDAAGILDSIGTRGLVLLVLPTHDDTVEKSFRNLANVRIAFPGNLGAYDVVYADWIVFTSPAIEAVKP
ncbi:MAG TPA: 50S ribosomal protein L4 [Actinomycetota bacterium]|nr:50S ribosomal protein L4 [Actinomycetota bacterium]